MCHFQEFAFQSVHHFYPQIYYLIIQLLFYIHHWFSKWGLGTPRGPGGGGGSRGSPAKFVNTTSVILTTLTIILYFGYSKIADLQAHSRAPSAVLWLVDLLFLKNPWHKIFLRWGVRSQIHIILGVLDMKRFENHWYILYVYYYCCYNNDLGTRSNFFTPIQDTRTIQKP